MTKSTFGEHLRREREMRGVSLEEISAATRIGTRFLEALENEQWDRLPGGVFNRGFVRAIARFLGLDEETLVGEYALATNDRLPAGAWTGNVPPADSRARRLPWLLALLAVAIAAAGWFAWRGYVSWRTARRASAAAASKATPSAPLPSFVAEAPEMLELKIEAGKTTAVRVVADGKRAFDGKFTAGQTQRFRAREQLEVWTRNSSALLLELNGQTLAPLGPPGRPAKATLTRKDLKKPRGGPD